MTQQSAARLVKIREQKNLRSRSSAKSKHGAALFPPLAGQKGWSPFAANIVASIVESRRPG
jgi:hypothetical protein